MHESNEDTGRPVREDHGPAAPEPSAEQGERPTIHRGAPEEQGGDLEEPTEAGPVSPAGGEGDAGGGDRETASTSEPPSSSPAEYTYGYPYDEDPYASPPPATPVSQQPVPAIAPYSPASPPPPAPPPPAAKEDEEDEEEGMLRMSFLEHLEELRTRIFRILAGIAVAFALSLVFANRLWLIISEPAAETLRALGYESGELYQISPMETFNIVWIKLPILTAIFLSSPWTLYQVWAFIAPGLYKRERRWAAPFVICSAGLFVTGGLFAYFVAFRFGLAFLLGIGRDIRIRPIVTVTEYFDLFVNVVMAIGVVFLLPVLIFFLTLLRIVTPGFLLRNTRYAVLVIVILAAIVTPTPDVFNLMIFSVPMILLFFIGVFASYLLVLHREQRRFPWAKVLGVAGILLLLTGAAAAVAIFRFGYHFVPHWPFLGR